MYCVGDLEKECVVERDTERTDISVAGQDM